jgi:hypothetical protein
VSFGARFIFCDLITNGGRLFPSAVSLPFAKGYRAAKVYLYLSIYSPTCRSLVRRQDKQAHSSLLETESHVRDNEITRFQPRG